jgi:hypothetical protein
LLLDTAMQGQWEAFRNALSHLILPASLLGYFSLAYISRMTRSFMLNELSQEYVVAARAKGLSEARIIWRHALRNAMVPLVTVITLSYAGLLEGSVLTETVFAWPGLGAVHHQLAAKRRHERGAGRNHCGGVGVHRTQSAVGLAIPARLTQGRVRDEFSTRHESPVRGAACLVDVGAPGVASAGGRWAVPMAPGGFLPATDWRCLVLLIVVMLVGWPCLPTCWRRIRPQWATLRTTRLLPPSADALVWHG